ncbi:hypothetical protein ATANTOWER_011768 [Ataeniobius toweri]|uniref:Uncharacterized protein n=1 Tax=Ataeniobius toweri TaxID=208326 RepID=A0ABU7BGT2_9TELE|nr:hypothetical protein [Ataeniobius toweri]
MDRRRRTTTAKMVAGCTPVYPRCPLEAPHLRCWSRFTAAVCGLQLPLKKETKTCSSFGFRSEKTWCLVGNPRDRSSVA